MISRDGDLLVAGDMNPTQVSIGQRPHRTIRIESSLSDSASWTSSWSANTVKHIAARPAWSWKSPIVWLNKALERVFGIRIKRVAALPDLLCSEYENEDHHRSYGGPWCRGRDHLNSLICEGLDPDDYVLDLGCGSMRVGIWLTQYLNAGRYFGLENFPGQEAPEGASNTKDLARLMFTKYAWPFEIASIVLLVGIIGAVMLTLRKRADNKAVNPVDQIKVKRSDRVRMVKMESEGERSSTEPDSTAKGE